MLYGVIDLGSNSIRLSVYSQEQGRLHKLFDHKVTAGLAGRVRGGRLTAQGVQAAREALVSCREVAHACGLVNPPVLATASLRNITNSTEVAQQLERDTGLTIRLLSGEEEARLDALGALYALKPERGLLLDIGGGSTELAPIKNGQIQGAASLPMGSLSLYREHVSRILPSKPQRRKLRGQARDALRTLEPQPERYPLLVGVGGTLRAAARLSQALCPGSASPTSFCASCIKRVLKAAKGEGKAFRTVVLTVPDRLHTIVPGLILLQEVLGHYGCDTVQISPYGLREGFLLRDLHLI